MNTAQPTETTPAIIPAAKKQMIIHALRAFIGQRSGIDFRDYQCGNYQDSRRAFNGDYLPILRHGRHARQLLREVELRESITAEDLIEASRAFSGRLQFKFSAGGATCAVDYCTGQYFPTEYRSAACAVLASALWAYWRESMPEPKTRQHGGADNLPMQTVMTYDGLSAGDWLRRKARRELGRSIAAKWFN